MPCGPWAPVGPCGSVGPCAPVNRRGPVLPRSCARTEGLIWPMLVMTKWLAAPARLRARWGNYGGEDCGAFHGGFLRSGARDGVQEAAPDSVGRGPPVTPLAERGVDRHLHSEHTGCGHAVLAGERVDRERVGSIRVHDRHGRSQPGHVRSRAVAGDVDRVVAVSAVDRDVLDVASAT